MDAPGDPASCAGASRAKTSRSRAQARGLTAAAPVCGGSSRAPSKSSSRKLSCLRTSQLSWLEVWERFSVRLPASGSMLSGAVFERPTLERRTSVAASSSSPHKAAYPTPTASPYGKSGNARGNPERRRESLDTMAAHWPTPTATLWAGAKSYSTESGRHSGTTLIDAAALHHGRPPGATATAGPDGLVLCPEFVEALMGFPEGWTLVDDEPASAALETPSSRPKRRRRSPSSGSA
jgi:hypothetical protein